MANRKNRVSDPPLREYVYRENNSFGVFLTDAPHEVRVTARSTEEADAIAERDHGVYFDGVVNGRDCECCDDRWYRAYDLQDRR